MKKLYCAICSTHRKLKTLKMLYIFKKKFVLSIICSNCKNEDEKLFKEESIEILKISGLFRNSKLVF